MKRIILPKIITSVLVGLFVFILLVAGITIFINLKAKQQKTSPGQTFSAGTAEEILNSLTAPTDGEKTEAAEEIINSLTAPGRGGTLDEILQSLTAPK